MILVSSIRHFTQVRTIALGLGALGCFIKIKPWELVAAELRGLNQVSGLLPTPRFYAKARLNRRRGFLIYQLWPNTGINSGLFVDLINRGLCQETREYVETLVQRFRELFLKTVCVKDSSAIVTTLFQKRAESGGRLSKFYGDALFRLSHDETALPSRDFGNFKILINGSPASIDWGSLLTDLAKWARAPNPTVAVLSQGDPTEVNLAWPFGVFDFDTAGYNSMVGEMANFCWAMAAQGGYLVPLYNPAAIQFHPDTLGKLPCNRPDIHVAINPGNRLIDIHYREKVDCSRRYVLQMYIAGVVEPLLEHCGLSREAFSILARPYLILRIIGTFNLTSMHPDDSAYCLAKTLECLATDFDFWRFFGILGASETL